jgi:hypothetical protein
MVTAHVPIDRSHSQNPAAIPDDIVREVCSRLFASLPRSDQRRKGEQYLRGLLSAEGRKSIRNIAAGLGGRAAEQSLHHFISSSTWDWMPVREELARYVERLVTPQAWVVTSMLIRKAGRHSVGVARRFVPGLGQVVNSQQAYGAWSACEEMTVPVNWRLLLSGDWLSDARLRQRVGLPAVFGAPAESVCPADAALEMATALGTGRRPVVLDLPDADPAGIAARCTLARAPFVARAQSSTRVVVADPAVPGFSTRDLPAQQLLQLVRPLRRPVEWSDPAGRGPRCSLVAAVRVQLAAARGTDRPLLLLGEWSDPRRWPDRCWVTDLHDTPHGTLLRLAKLAGRAAAAFAAVSERVGMPDFEGRSFEGWHRHVTLASAAHAICSVSRTGVRGAAYAVGGV